MLNDNKVCEKEDGFFGDIVDIYCFANNRPLLYSTKSNPVGDYMLWSFGGDAGDGNECWCGVRMSEDRFEAMRSGKISFREAFTGSESGKVSVVNIDFFDGGKETCHEIQSSDIPEDVLPNESLNVNSQYEDAPQVESN